MPKSKKTYLNIRLYESQKERIKEQAKTLNKSITNYVLEKCELLSLFDVEMQKNDLVKAFAVAKDYKNKGLNFSEISLLLNNSGFTTITNKPFNAKTTELLLKSND